MRFVGQTNIRDNCKCENERVVKAQKRAPAGIEPASLTPEVSIIPLNYRAFIPTGGIFIYYMSVCEFFLREADRLWL